MSAPLDPADEVVETKKFALFRTFFKEKLKPFFFKQFMTIGILIALLVGFVFPKLGDFVGSWKGSTYVCVIMIFLHSGLKLKVAAIKDVFKQYRGFIWGVISIILITTLISTEMTKLLPFGDCDDNDGNKTKRTCHDSVVGPREFLLGLEIYYISPCTVAAGVVLTSLAGGDVTLALLLTVTTNILGVVTVPLLASWLVSVKNVKISAVSLLIKMSCTVLAPLIVGKLLTNIKVVEKFVQSYTKTLKMCSITFLICIPWMKISKAKLSGSFEKVTVLNLFLVFLWGLGLHIIMLVVNFLGALLIRVNLAARKTLVILASTKTLAISLSVISFLDSDIGDPGLMSLPLIVLHLALLLIDSAWVVRWNKVEEVKEEEPDAQNDATEAAHVSLTNSVRSYGVKENSHEPSQC